MFSDRSSLGGLRSPRAKGTVGSRRDASFSCQWVSAVSLNKREAEAQRGELSCQGHVPGQKPRWAPPRPLHLSSFLTLKEPLPQPDLGRVNFPGLAGCEPGESSPCGEPGAGGRGGTHGLTSPLRPGPPARPHPGSRQVRGFGLLETGLHFLPRLLCTPQARQTLAGLTTPTTQPDPPPPSVA